MIARPISGSARGTPTATISGLAHNTLHPHTHATTELGVYTPRMPSSDTHATHQAGALPDTAVLKTIAETMPAFAAASRVRLLYALAGGEHTVTQLATIAQATPAAVSQQLRVLRNLKLVATRREGQSVHYRLYDDHVSALLTEIRHHAEHAQRGWSTPPATQTTNTETTAPPKTPRARKPTGRAAN